VENCETVAFMRRQNLLLVVSIALASSGLATAQTAPQGGGRPTHGAQNQAAPPANNASTSTMPGTQTPVRQPTTSPPPSTATRAIPPAMRGVGTTENRPDCSQKRGIEKSECERRDTSRDDLPAGATTTQQPKPPQ
jgi:hypothetical protein